MWCRSPTHRNSRSLARERSLRCFMCRGSGARFVVLCVYVFSCLYVVAALIIVEILSELLEIVLTTIRLEEQQLLDGPRHKRRRQEWSPFHIFWYFQCFLSLSLFPALRISWQCLCTRPVHPYREYPLLRAPSVHSYRDCPFLLSTLSPLHLHLATTHPRSLCAPISWVPHSRLSVYLYSFFFPVRS
jgi:hypothetical protein